MRSSSILCFHLRLGYAMLAQRNGLPPGAKPVPLKDPPDLQDVDTDSGGCCSLSSSPSSGSCPWAKLAGVDGCLSEPYCLWFQLLARAYWGEVELGITSPNRSVSWARLREASRKNCVRSRVRRKHPRGLPVLRRRELPGRVCSDEWIPCVTEICAMAILLSGRGI